MFLTCAISAQNYFPNMKLSDSTGINDIDELKPHITLSDGVHNTSTKKQERNLIKKEGTDPSAKIAAEFFRTRPSEFPAKNKPDKQEFNFVNSFRENIRFGGFWNKYAIVNFNPSVNLKPADFINIYANENLSCFVPINEVKNYLKLLMFHSAAILAVDNSVKLLFKQNEWIAQATGFIAKNLVILILKEQLFNRNSIYNHDSFYFAVSVKF